MVPKRVTLTDIETNVLRALAKGTANPAEIAESTGASEDDVRRALDRLVVLGMVEAPEPPLPTLDAIDAAIRQLDGKAACDTASRALMASFIIGSGDEAKLAAIGLPPDELAQVGQRFRMNGIWDAGGVAPPDEGVEFWLMVAAGNGEVTRSFNNQTGEWNYSMTPDGIARVEKLIRK